ncbi:MAG: SRPBCC family protein [Myxococcales bacterium]|nr:SRPBCC family protein [Myxococcales bacterium]
MNKRFFIVAFAIGWIASSTTSDVLADEADAVFTVQITEKGSSIASGQASVELDQPIDEVLPIVLDYANYVQFMPNFTKSRVLAQRGSRARVYMEVSVAKGALTLWGQLNIAERSESEQPGRVIEASLLEGNIDAFNARWELTPIDDGARTRVSFKIYVDPDIPLPSSVFSRENERAAGKTLRALRLRVAEAPLGST